MKSFFVISLLTASLATQVKTNDVKENMLAKFVDRATNFFVKNQVSS
jgi:hypothetical protein